MANTTRTGARRFRRAAAITALMALVGFSVPSVAASVDDGHTGHSKPTDLAITLTGPGSVAPGAGVSVTFTATASNAAGAAKATNVVIDVAPLTNPLALITWTGCVSNPTPMSCAIGSLNGGASKSVTYEVSTPAGTPGPSFTTSATVTSPQDPMSPGASAIVFVGDTVLPAGFSIVKSTLSTPPQTGGYRPGDQLVYSILVSNGLTSTLHNLTISDPHADFGLVPAPADGVLQCTTALPITNFAPGDQELCFGAHIVTQADVDSGATFTNTATAKVDGRSPISASVVDPLDQTVTLTTFKDFVSPPPPGDYHAGDVLDFSITASNDGSVTVKNVSMTDATSTLDACPTTSLAAQQKLVCTAHHTITQAEIDAGTYTNTAVITSDGTKPQQASVEVVLPKNPMVTLTKAVTSVTAATGYDLGNTITYLLTAKNTGNATLHAVTITDTGAVLGTCPPTDLAPGAELTCSASHVVTQADIDTAATYTNAADVTTLEAVTDHATADADLHRVASLGITKNLTSKVPASPNPSTVLTFQIVVTNNGTRTLTNVDVLDNQATLSCVPALPLATMAPGETATCTATSAITQADIDAGSFTNTASATSSLTDPVSADAFVPLPASPSLGVTKTVTGEGTYVLGSVATFAVTITNDGNVTLYAVTLSDPTATTGNCSIGMPGTLAPGASVTCPVSHTVTQADVDAGSYTNVATATGSRGTTAQASATVQVSQTRGFTLTKQVAVDPAPPVGGYKVGDTITFDLTATNTGTVTAPTVTITETTASSTLGACPATTLAPLASFTCHATHVVTQADLDGGTYTNTADATVSQWESSVSARATVELSGSRSLRLDKSVTSAGPYVLGSTVTYDIVASNNGTLTLTGVQVSDTTPGVVMGTCAPVIGVDGVSLAPGQSVTCTATHIVTEADFTNGSFTNSANASAGGVEGVKASATVATPFPAVDLMVTNTRDTALSLGLQATYTLTFANAGPGNEPAPVATFTLPTGETIVSATGSGWSCSAAGAKVTCTSATALVAGGSLPNITVVVNVTALPATSLTTTATISGVRTELQPSDNTADATGLVDPAVLGVTTSPGQLPSTGSNVLMPLVLAAGMLGLGLALFVVTRRRSTI